MRLLLASCLLLVCLGAYAEAEEIFELDNGVVVRGYVMREDGDRLTIRLAGFPEPSTVTIERGQIAKRYDAGTPPAAGAVPGGSSYVARASPRPGRGPIAPETTHVSAPSDTSESFAEESPRPMREEHFAERFLRILRISIPDTPHSRVTLSLLLVVVLMMLISVGARMLDMDGVSLVNAGILAILMATAAVANVMYFDHLLRADRALWLVPLEVLGWTGAARLLLGWPFPRAVLLFTFVLVSLGVVVFATGAVLVAV